jgi:hypothetical protein
MDGTYDQAQQLRTEKAVAKKEIHDKLNFTEQQLLLLTQEMKDKIRQMVEDVEQRVSHFMGTFVIGFILIYRYVMAVNKTVLSHCNTLVHKQTKDADWFLPVLKILSGHF